MRRRLLSPVLALVAAVALLVPAWLSPTLPLPPPEQPSTITPDARLETWDIYGSCTAGARVTVFNENTRKGAMVEDTARTGHYHVTIEGAQCDLASVREETDEGVSEPTTFVLAARKPGDPTDNPICH